LRKYDLSFTTDRAFTPMSKSELGENAAIAIRDGRANTFGGMGADLLDSINDETAFINEEDWNPSNRFWRDTIDWTPDLTIGGAAKMAEVYDLDKEYDYISKRSGWFTGAMRGTLNIATMMVADEVNLIPIVGQFAKIGQGLKTGSRIYKTVFGPSKTLGGAFTKGLAQTTPFTAAEAFLLYPQSEKLRRQQDIEFGSQLLSFALGTAAGGAFSTAGYKFSKMLTDAKNRKRLATDDQMNTPEAKQRQTIINKEEAKLNIKDAKLVEVDVEVRPDVGDTDLQKIVINNKTKNQNFDADGVNTKQANGVTRITATRNTVSITTKRSELQKVLESIDADNLQVDTVSIKIRGTKQRGTFSKNEILAVDPVLQSLGVAKKTLNKKQTMLEVKFGGETYALRSNDKTGEVIAYKRDANGNYSTPEDAQTSLKIFHGATTKNNDVKKQIKDNIEGNDKVTQTEATEIVEDTVDARNEHKSKTHEEVADDMTSEGYKNIETPEQLSTLPVTVGVQTKYVNAINNGQSTSTRSVFVDGQKVEKTTDLSILKNEIDNLNDSRKLLEDVESKLDDLMVCNATN
jgi:hypothetical protein